MKSGLYKVGFEVDGVEISTFVVYSGQQNKFFGAKFDFDSDQDGLRMMFNHDKVKKELIMEDDNLIIAPSFQDEKE